MIISIEIDFTLEPVVRSQACSMITTCVTVISLDNKQKLVLSMSLNEGLYAPDIDSHWDQRSEFVRLSVRHRQSLTLPVYASCSLINLLFSITLYINNISPISKCCTINMGIQLPNSCSRVSPSRRIVWSFQKCKCNYHI